MPWMRNLLHWWDTVLWQRRDPPPMLPLALAVTMLRTVALTVSEFRHKRLLLHASDLSFYVALSIVPSLAFIMLVLKVFDLSHVVQPALLTIVSAGNIRLIENLSRFIANAQGIAVSGVGVVLLFAVGFMMLQRVKAALNNIWGIRHPPRYGHRLIEYVVVLTLSPLVLATTFSLTTFLNSIRLGEALRHTEVIADIYPWLLAYSSVPLFVAVLLYAYMFLPDTRVRWPAALTGAIVAAVLIQIMQDFYLYIFFKLSAYNMIYGAFAVLPFMMIWFYLAWILFLFGAQLSAVVQTYHLLLAHGGPRGRSALMRPYVVLAVLIAVLREFERRGRPARLRSLARQLGLPPGAVAEVLRELTEAALVTPVMDRRNLFVPAQRLDRVSAHEALRRMQALPRFAEHPDVGRLLANPALGRLFSEVNHATARPLAEVTIAELLRRSEAARDDAEALEEGAAAGAEAKAAPKAGLGPSRAAEG